ncbi:similar to Saccharomyces cerevisiae YEL062W NPR2 Subunit of the conserved Npr2/3 complex that mediates downregulation of TORC1 activity upon amino acid limitation [Maudiozyma saulgeensis]|uniref:Similar to Saccharomyces cerevisiae YEL062W NPR2 Subunit of the conserved Npr2/3 complex that mediates downregulation of TORC1 activity upon amino acid limitation n=1 Tax=Maudiozyma saulgeensis TaxID=1789683 RepID=A0A1X7RBB0_9SACH|nr:similar to Saccharomyces cerevisiae YEL062W NPR2 Subunit of the conserved Npr2/3 complex that mediates downregulation of TORC1 activity upon amino acid limitation [Kazachstania saulgeensis]
MDRQFKGFEPIHTVFYSNFHPTEGSKVCYQFPPNNLQNYNINFNSVKNYIIPKLQLCHKLLTMKYENYRIVSYPVTVNSQSYARNFFSFNFVFIFPYDCETSPYEPAIARLAKMFRVLEEQNQILSLAENDPVFFKDPSTLSNKPDSSFSIQDLIMRIYQDLNSYSECLIPINDANTVDIKLFPLVPPPTAIQLSVDAVPISVVNMNKVIDLNWDPTMLNILPFINGLNSISNISKLSDSDSNLVIECIRHLIYYKCVIITDIFQFSNIYAPTNLITTFLSDPKLSYDCQLYVTLPKNADILKLPFNELPISNSNSNLTSATNLARGGTPSHKKTSSMSSQNSTANRLLMSPARSSITSSSISSLYPNRKHSESSLSSDGQFFRSSDKYNYLPTRSTLFDLYRSLNHAITIQTWYERNYDIINTNNIDIRRLIKFGITKRLIYRVYSYPIMSDNKMKDKTTLKKGNKDNKNDFLLSTSDIKFDVGDKLLNSIYKKLSKVSFDSATPSHDMLGSTTSVNRTKIKGKCTLGDAERQLLIEALDNFESFDKICVRLGKPRAEVELLLREIGQYKIINI